MKKILALVLSCAALLAGPAVAQDPPRSPIYQDRNGNYQGASGMFQVTSTPASAPAIATVVPADGQRVIPFTPEVGRPIWLKYAPDANTTFTVTLAESTNGCVSYTGLTVGGSPVSFASLYNEYWGILPATPRTLCQIVNVTAGSLAVEARN